jgi:NADPH:quinone reductase-like Zn-dependent oxidoreductase
MIVQKKYKEENKMQAFMINSYNQKTGLQAAEMPTPALKEYDVLVEVHAASVNVLDIKIKKGEFKLILPYKLPLIMGKDMAEVVAESLHTTLIGIRVLASTSTSKEKLRRIADFSLGILER